MGTAKTVDEIPGKSKTAQVRKKSGGGHHLRDKDTGKVISGNIPRRDRANEIAKDKVGAKD